MNKISIIIPAKNESQTLRVLVPQLISSYPEAEIIIVDDGSTDDTQEILKNLQVKSVKHPYSIGNGAAIKTGARTATGDVFVFLDGDGQHQVEDIAILLNKYNEGYDMVVGARNKSQQANFIRYLGNSFYNILASFIVGKTVEDLTSGFRIVNATKFKQFLHLLPNGFSTPSTITMAFFRQGYSCTYLPINVKPRLGTSHLNVLKDGFRFLLIIYKMTIYHSPLKVFLPFSVICLFLGLLNYVYTFSVYGRFTNMSALLLSVSLIVFLIGLISEQITALMYSQFELHNKRYDK